MLYDLHQLFYSYLMVATKNDWLTNMYNQKNSTLLTNTSFKLIKLILETVEQNLVVVASSLLTFNSYLPREWFYTLHPYTQYKKKQILVQILFYHPAMPAKIIQGTTKFSRIRVILLELSDEWFNTAWSEHGDLRTPM